MQSFCALFLAKGSVSQGLKDKNDPDLSRALIDVLIARGARLCVVLR
jgi:hypothetical protein